MIIDSWAHTPFLSFDAVCVSSPVIIILFFKKVNIQVHKKLEFSTRVGTISSETSWSSA